jgi:diguanylate cyclase (GGDEF)-like protein
MGAKLTNMITFDAAVFYVAHLSEGVVKAEHVVGPYSSHLQGLTIPLEQKLSGWVAANNQALCNLPPFPDFLSLPEPRPVFGLSAIVPLHREGQVIGTIALYRRSDERFSDADFRRLEILASQTALAITRTISQSASEPVLFDPITNIPNAFQLFLMFDQLANDALRFDYPIALFCIGLDNVHSTQRRWGYGTADELAQFVIQNVASALAETDLLFRYSDDQLILLSPRVDRERAEDLKSRLQDLVDQLYYQVRPDTSIHMSTAIGIVMFPTDETGLERLIETASWRMDEDRHLRAAASRQGSLLTS